MQEKAPQHYRVTLEQAKRDYQDGLLTATGLVFYAVSILRPPGQKLRISSANEFAEQLGIKKTSFYRALSLLKLKNLLEWEPTGGLILWISLSKGVADISDARDAQAKPTAESPATALDCNKSVTIFRDRGIPVPNRGIESQIAESQSQIAESQSQIAESQSQIAESQSQIAEWKTTKPASDKDSGSSPDITDIYQIFIQSLSDVERENFLNFSRKTVNELPSKPVLPKMWITKYHQELWRQYKGTNEVGQESKPEAIAIAIPSLEQMAKLQELKDTGKIKDFYPNSQTGNGTIIVDTGSEILLWYEFFKTLNLEP